MSMTDRTPIHVGPDHDPALEQAVVAGGGTVTGPDDAVGIVYQGPDDPALTASMVTPLTRWVQLPHAGVERWAEAEVVTRHPVWTSAAGVYGPQVAEHALALMLLAARGLHTAARARSWGDVPARVLAGSTVGLVGYGGIGRSLARLLLALDCRLLAVSDSGVVDEAERTVARASYRDVLPAVDYVVLLAPLTPQTRGMIAAPELEMMRSQAWLVNLARGGLVVTDDLVHALRHGQVGGAALDVTDPEPLPEGHPLWSLPNVLVTPHIANPSAARDAALAQRVSDNVARLARGAPLLGVIDPDAGF